MARYRLLLMLAAVKETGPQASLDVADHCFTDGFDISKRRELHHPPAALGNVLVRDRLKAVDHRRQFLRVEPVRLTEANEVDEANRERTVRRGGLRPVELFAIPAACLTTT